MTNKKSIQLIQAFNHNHNQTMIKIKIYKSIYSTINKYYLKKNWNFGFRKKMTYWVTSDWRLDSWAGSVRPTTRGWVPHFMFFLRLNHISLWLGSSLYLLPSFLTFYGDSWLTFQRFVARGRELAFPTLSPSLVSRFSLFVFQRLCLLLCFFVFLNREIIF